MRDYTPWRYSVINASCYYSTGVELTTVNKNPRLHLPLPPSAMLVIIVRRFDSRFGDRYVNDVRRWSGLAFFRSISARTVRARAPAAMHEKSKPARKIKAPLRAYVGPGRGIANKSRRFTERPGPTSLFPGENRKGGRKSGGEKRSSIAARCPLATARSSLPAII